MLSEHISGESFITPARRSSTAMVGEPPVVMFTTASVACLMRGRNCMNTAGSPVGRPSCGLRACRCRIAAPASAAPIACSAIWSGVTGRASDMVGVWIAPVTAQLMMTLSDLPAEAVGEQAPEAFRREQHDGDRHRAQHQEVEAAEIGQRLPQQEEHDGAD